MRAGEIAAGSAPRAARVEPVDGASLAEPPARAATPATDASSAPHDGHERRPPGTDSPQSGQAILRGGHRFTSVRARRTTGRRYTVPDRPSVFQSPGWPAADPPNVRCPRVTASTVQAAWRHARDRPGQRQPPGPQHEEHEQRDGADERVSIDERGPESGPGDGRRRSRRDDDEQQGDRRDAEQDQRPQRMADGVVSRRPTARRRSGRRRGRSAAPRCRRRSRPTTQTITTTTIASGTPATIRQTIGVVTSLGTVSSAYVTATVRAEAQIAAAMSGNNIVMRTATIRSACRLGSKAWAGAAATSASHAARVAASIPGRDATTSSSLATIRMPSTSSAAARSPPKTIQARHGTHREDEQDHQVEREAAEDEPDDGRADRVGEPDRGRQDDDRDQEDDDPTPDQEAAQREQPGGRTRERHQQGRDEGRPQGHGAGLGDAPGARPSPGASWSRRSRAAWTRAISSP